MPSQVKLDQDTLSPAGTPGKSRTDGLAGGQLVTLTNTGSDSTTRFQLLDVPPGDSSAVGSLTATGPKVWTFSPTANKPGTYLVELIGSEGQPTEYRERRTFTVRTPLVHLVIPALNERGDPSASLQNAGAGPIAAADNNADDYADSALNSRRYAAWWRGYAELVKAVDVAGGAAQGATGAANGYLSRHVYVNAGSVKVGTIFAGAVVQAAATFTTSADVPPGNFFDVVEVGAGGPGSGANQNATSGGYGGGGGCYRRFRLSRAELIALLPVTLVIPLGPAGGAGNTGSNPGVGTAAAPTAFGPFKAYAGGAGARGEAVGRASATGGGSLGTGASPGTSATAQDGGLPGDTGRGKGTGGAGCVGGTGSAETSQCSEDGGASGANVHSVSGTGGRALRGGGGGGAGGQWNTIGAQDGGDGGSSGVSADAERGGGGTGGAHAASGGTPGTAGAAGADGTIDHAGSGGGGGGAGGTTSGAGNGGTGGDGGFPGGASGGGGGSGSGTGGDGGKPGDAAIILTAYA